MPYIQNFGSYKIFLEIQHNVTQMSNGGHFHRYEFITYNILFLFCDIESQKTDL